VLPKTLFGIARKTHTVGLLQAPIVSATNAFGQKQTAAQPPVPSKRLTLHYAPYSKQR